MSELDFSLESDKPLVVEREDWDLDSTQIVWVQTRRLKME